MINKQRIKYLLNETLSEDEDVFIETMERTKQNVIEKKKEYVSYNSLIQTQNTSEKTNDRYTYIYICAFFSLLL